MARETTAEPETIRYRINHTWTEKRGWRWETTVELHGPTVDPLDMELLLEHAMRRADDLARAEAKTRDAIDRRDVAA